MDNFSKFLIESSVQTIDTIIAAASTYHGTTLDEATADEEYENRLKRGDDFHKASKTVREDVNVDEDYFAHLLNMLIEGDYIETVEDLIELRDAAAAMKRYFEMGPGDAAKDLPKNQKRGKSPIFGEDPDKALDDLQRKSIFGKK